VRIILKLTSDRAAARYEKEAAEELARTAYLTNWHSKFVIYRMIKNYGDNTKTHIWFETVSRRGDSRNTPDGPRWYWFYKLL
jgi:hypothetical protein